MALGKSDAIGDVFAIPELAFTHPRGKAFVGNDEALPRAVPCHTCKDGSRKQRRVARTLRDDVRAGEKAPNVDHRLAGKVEVPIARVRRAENHQVALRDHVVERQQIGIAGDIGSVVNTAAAWFDNAFLNL